ncbi:MAG: hypothetical protein ACP5QH_05905 [Thermoplasmata archaeon]|jgi:ribosomal protein L24
MEIMYNDGENKIGRVLKINWKRKTVTVQEYNPIKKTTEMKEVSIFRAIRPYNGIDRIK